MNNLSRRDALKISLKGSTYVIPVVLGAIAATPASAVSPTPTPARTSTPVIPTATPIPTSTPVVPPATALPITAPTLTPIPTLPPVVPTATALPSSTPTPTLPPSFTITPTAGPAGTIFTVTIANFSPSTTGFLQLYMRYDNAPSFPITTDANGSGTATISNLSTTPGFYSVSVYLGNVHISDGMAINILAPPFVGNVTVTSAGGCYPTVVSGSDFPPGISFIVSIVDPAGTKFPYGYSVYVQADGTFQAFFNSNFLPIGPLKAVVEAEGNGVFTTAFTQMACTGTRPIFYSTSGPITGGGSGPLPVFGSNFPSVGMITISVQAYTGKIVGSITVTETNGSFSGTFNSLSPLPFYSNFVRIIATATSSNEVLAITSVTVK